MKSTAEIERGIVTRVKDGKCKVSSISSFGLETPYLPCTEDIHENDVVYYFMFDDGKGRVIGKAE